MPGRATRTPGDGEPLTDCGRLLAKDQNAASRRANLSYLVCSDSPRSGNRRGESLCGPLRPTSDKECGP